MDINPREQYFEVSSQTETSQLGQMSIQEMNNKKAQFSKKLSIQILQNLRSNQWRKAISKTKQLCNRDSQQFIPQYKILIQQLSTSWKKNKQQIFLLQLMGYLANKVTKKQDKNQLQETIADISVNLLQCVVDQQIQDEMKLLKMWEAYIELLRSFCYISLNLQFDENNWFYFDIFTAVLLPKLECKTIQKLAISNNVKRGKQIYNLFFKFMKQQSQCSQLIRRQLFHQISLLLKIFIADIKVFMNRDSNLLAKFTQQINCCTLVMKIITNKFEGENVKYKYNDSINKIEAADILYCVMLLLTILQSQQPPSQNYKQILSFMLYIIIYSIQDEERQGLTLQNKNLELNLYVAQLFSMLCFRNIEFVVKQCRSAKIVKKIFLFFKAMYHLTAKQNKSIQNIQIYMKRLNLGLCGIMKIRTMETETEQLIKQLFPLMIQLVQKEQDLQNQEYEVVNKEQKVENIYNFRGWNQEYYTKHNSKDFEAIDEIHEITEAVRSIKDYNQQLFFEIMQNFDEIEMMMWRIELQDKKEKQEHF